MDKHTHRQWGRGVKVVATLADLSLLKNRLVSRHSHLTLLIVWDALVCGSWAATSHGTDAQYNFMTPISAVGTLVWAKTFLLASTLHMTIVGSELVFHLLGCRYGKINTQSLSRYHPPCIGGRHLSGIERQSAACRFPINFVN